MSSIQCIPAKAPGSGHRQGDCHEPPQPRALRCSLPRRWPWPCWEQCQPALAIVDGLKCQARRHFTVGQGSASPLLRAPGASPVGLPSQGASSVPPIPTPFPGLAGPFARLLTVPEPGSHRRPGPQHCWCQEGSCCSRPALGGPGGGCCGQLGSRFLVDWFGRGKRILRMFSSWFIRYLPPKVVGGGAPSGWVPFLLLAE